MKRILILLAAAAIAAHALDLPIDSMNAVSPNTTIGVKAPLAFTRKNSVSTPGSGGVLWVNNLDQLKFTTSAGTITIDGSAGGTGTSTAILMGDGSGGFAEVTIGGALSFTGGTLTVASGGISNAMLGGSIALSKLATDPLARANHTGSQTLSTISDAGTLAGLNAIATAQITNGTIVDADISGSAAIDVTKIDFSSAGVPLDAVDPDNDMVFLYDDSSAQLARRPVSALGGGVGDALLAGDQTWTGTNAFTGEEPFSIAATSGDFSGTFNMNSGAFSFKVSDSSTLAESSIAANTSDGIGIAFGDGTENPWNSVERGLAISVAVDKVSVGPKNANGTPGVFEVVGGRDDSGFLQPGTLRFHAADGKTLGLRASTTMADHTNWYLPSNTPASGNFLVVDSGSSTGATLGWSSSGASLTSLNASNVSSGTLAVARGGTGITSFGTGVATALGQNVTGSGSIVLAAAPTLTLANATGLPLATGVTGTLPAANGGTGITSLGTGVATALGQSLNTWATPPDVLVFLGSDQTSTSTSFADVSGLTFSVAANTSYAFEFEGGFSSSAATEGQALSVNGPASPTSISYTVQSFNVNDASAPPRSDFVTAYDSTAALRMTGPSPGGTTCSWRVKGILRNGANAGTLALRFRAETGGGNSVTIKAGSWATCGATN